MSLLSTEQEGSLETATTKGLMSQPRPAALRGGEKAESTGPQGWEQRPRDRAHEGSAEQQAHPVVALCTAGQLVASACRHGTQANLNHALSLAKARAREQTERQGGPHGTCLQKQGQRSKINKRSCKYVHGSFKSENKGIKN